MRVWQVPVSRNAPSRKGRRHIIASVLAVSLGLALFVIGGVSGWTVYTWCNTTGTLSLEMRSGLLNVGVADQPLFGPTGFTTKALPDNSLLWRMQVDGRGTYAKMGGWDGKVIASFGGPAKAGGSLRMTTIAIMPLAMATLAVGVLFAVLADRVRRKKGVCETCGYSLAGLAKGAVCPECGNGNGASDTR